MQLAAMSVAEGQERTGDSIAYVTSGLIRWNQTQGCWYLVTGLVNLGRVVA